MQGLENRRVVPDEQFDQPVDHRKRQRYMVASRCIGPANTPRPRAEAPSLHRRPVIAPWQSRARVGGH